jgi:hypothetical protein
MKKYRSLWCMSTTNHNILYFPAIPGTFLLNTGISLWKAQFTLARRGLAEEFALNPEQHRDPAPVPDLPKSLVPGPNVYKT